ncbi:MAG: hypothetical protein HY040_00855 [Planctomycetes bacterium]|nr:hypothetical protein [Planctomycetota bacterium]
MQRTLFLSVLATALIPGAASAQYFPLQRPQLNPYAQPAISPYLDIVRGGNPAINYYNGTLTEFDRRNNALQQQYMQSQVNQLQQQTTLLEEQDFIPALSQTGHAAGFQVYGGYYTFQNAPRSFFPLPTTRRR